MKTYNKLVRDLIPNIIEKDGKSCTIEILSDDDYLLKLNQKLQEEVNEYFESQDVEELADIMEVIYAIAKTKKINIQELENIRFKKEVERGAFDKKIMLKKVIE